MPTQYSPNNPLDVGLLGGFRGYQRDVQQQQTFNTSMAQAQQELFAKSLEIQDFIDGQKARSTERRVNTKKLESEERMLPEQEATDRLTMQANRAQTTLALAATKSEERARPLFNLSASNYDEMIGTIPEDLKKDLGLTGNSWAEDGPTILQARRTAIDSAAHMRAIELQGLRAEGSVGSSTVKAKAINLAKKNLMVVDQLLKNTDTYKALDSDSKATYRASITAVAQDLYQQNVDQVRNKQRSDLVPYSTYVDRVAQLANKYVDGENGFWAGVFNNRGFNAQGFNDSVSEAFGFNVNPKTVGALSGDVDTAAPEIDEFGGIDTIPPKTRKALSTASDVIQQARNEQGISDNISDIIIFNKLVKSGYLNSDGTRVKTEPKYQHRSRKAARTSSTGENPLGSFLEQTSGKSKQESRRGR